MAGDSKKLQPIIVKKIKKGGHGRHGGAWKIAYADFVTAMMAFFLLMWLLGSTTEGDKKGIADYFASPLKVALLGGGRARATRRTSSRAAAGPDALHRPGQERRHRGQAQDGQPAGAEGRADPRRDRRLEDLKRKVEERDRRQPERWPRCKSQIRWT
jgi:chemotaxis protein MotB